nr:NADH dehydrogenase subunit 2 [Carrikerella sp.]
MPKNSTKILLLLALVSGMLISLCANSWVGAWMGLEINLLSFIPLSSSNLNMLSSEASLKYFLIQAIASSALLFMVVLKTNLPLELELLHMNFEKPLNNLIIFPLIMKIAGAPLHWWLPPVVEGLSWMNCFIVLTIQKIAPIILISYTMINNVFTQIIIISSVFMGATSGFNQLSLRKILTFSSINHIGWMLMALIHSISLWLTYFIIYLLNILSIIYITSLFNISFISQTFNFPINQMINKILLFLSLLSLGGLPPLLGFFTKWLVIQTASTNSFYISISIMVMMSLITLFFYLRASYSGILILNNEATWFSMNFIYSPKKIMTINYLIICFGMLLCTLMLTI